MLCLIMYCRACFSRDNYSFTPVLLTPCILCSVSRLTTTLHIMMMIMIFCVEDYISAHAGGYV